MTTGPVLDHPVRLVADEQAELARELRQLPDEVWARPSRCAGWRNARVLAHLAAGAELYRQSVLRALDGDASLSDAAAQSVACFEVRQERLSEAPPSMLVTAFIASGGALDRLWSSLSPADFDRPAWHPMRQVTVGMLLALRIFELAFHGWDIRASVDAEAAIRPALGPFLVGFVRQAQRRFCRPSPDLEATCRFEVEAESWTLTVRDGQLDDAPPGARAELAVRTDPSTFLLLATRRRTLAEVSGAVAIRGAAERAPRVLAATSFHV
jgi:uncharacterized protein (TIGR03083 family)